MRLIETDLKKIELSVKMENQDENRRQKTR